MCAIKFTLESKYWTILYFVITCKDEQKKKKIAAAYVSICIKIYLPSAIIIGGKDE